MLQKNKRTLLKRSPLFIFALWIIALIIVNPIGEFPLNDDWAYSLVVQEWLDTGVYHVNDWPAMSLFAQICWGTLFAKIFGFSFTVLRFSTLVIATCGAYAFWVILKELDIALPYRSLALGVLLFNPLFFHLSNTFMTDVPFLSTCIIASLFYLKFIQQERLIWWCLALFFSVCAILIRQLGLLIPLAFVGAMSVNFIWRYRSGEKLPIQAFFLALLSVFLTYGSLKGYVYYLDQTTGIPAAFSQVGSITNRLSFPYISSSLVAFSGIYLMYLGAFLSPVLLRRFWIKSKVFYSLFGAFLFIFIFLISSNGDDFPLGNTMYNLSLGVVTLPDVLKKITSFPALSSNSFFVLKGIVLISTLLLSGHLAIGLKRLFSSIARTFSFEQIFKLGILFFILPYSFFLIIDNNHFDRYLLPLVPFLMILLLPKGKTPKRLVIVFSWILLLFMGIYSVGGTHDYLAWNKARWKALGFLENEHISPSKIDGGFEYNGWHQTYHRNPINPYAKSWWFVDEDDYAVAFQPYHNYGVKAVFPYKRLLSMSMDTVYALQRPAWKQVDTLFHDMESLGFNKETDSLYAQFSPIDLAAKDSFAYSGNHVFKMNEQDEYGLTHLLYPIKPYEQLSISMYVKGDESHLSIVNSAPDPSAFLYYHTPFKVKELEDGWKFITAEMKIPEDYPSDTLQLYLWKQHQKRIQIDDFKIIWRRY